MVLSATTTNVMASNVSGAARSYWIQELTWLRAPRRTLRRCTGWLSAAAAARCPRDPL